MRLTIVLTAVLAFPVAAGQMYVCTDSNGKKTFQQRPCAGDQQQATRKYKVREPDGQPQPVSLENNKIYQQMKADNRRAELKREIRKAEQQIDRYRARMDAEMRALRNKKRYANNNLAGAAWENSISSEMEAVTAKYTSMMEVERDRLNIMRQELASL